jgi:hypothetical protein
MTTAALDAGSVVYEGQVLSLTEVLNEIKIGNLTLEVNSLPLYERGQTIRTISLGWSYNFDVTSQTLTSPLGLLNLESNIRQVTLSDLAIAANTSISISGSSSIQTVTSEALIRFGRRIYYGTNNDILNIPLNSSVTQLFNSKVYYSYLDFNINLKNIQGYIYILVPTRFIPIGSILNIYSNNLLDTSWVITNVQIKNPFNHVESYKLYRTIYKHKGGNIQLRLVNDRS